MLTNREVKQLPFVRVEAPRLKSQVTATLLSQWLIDICAGPYSIVLGNDYKSDRATWFVTRRVDGEPQPTSHELSAVWTSKMHYRDEHDVDSTTLQVLTDVLADEETGKGYWAILFEQESDAQQFKALFGKVGK